VERGGFEALTSAVRGNRCASEFGEVLVDRWQQFLHTIGSPGPAVGVRAHLKGGQVGRRLETLPHLSKA
jgi:hypothetical protein